MALVNIWRCQYNNLFTIPYCCRIFGTFTKCHGATFTYDRNRRWPPPSVEHFRFLHKNTNSTFLTRSRLHNFVQIRPAWAKALVESSPPSWQPYLRLMRMDKPAGTWLLFWPCTWSLALATPVGQFPDLYFLSLFGIGSLLMRSAGCVINDLYDKDFDSKVERTKLRPLASGELTNFQALKLLSGLLTASLCVLLQFNWFSVAIGAASLLPVASYPLFKRFTHWPQIVLGLTFNWGCFMGWSAIENSLDIQAVLPLYLCAVCWTMIYDTIYAHQDKHDDVLIGVKSTAIKMGDLTKYWLAGFGATMVGSLGLAGYNVGLAWPFYAGLGLTAGHVAWQVFAVDINKPEDCWKKFSTNKYLGLIIFLSILSGKYFYQ